MPARMKARKRTFARFNFVSQNKLYDEPE